MSDLSTNKFPGDPLDSTQLNSTQLDSTIIDSIQINKAQDKSELKLTLFVSLIIHVLVLSLIYFKGYNDFEEPLEVSLVEFIPKNSKQQSAPKQTIASTQSSKEPENNQPKLLSDKDNNALNPTIKRGEQMQSPATGAAKNAPQQNQPPSPKQPQAQPSENEPTKSTPKKPPKVEAKTKTDAKTEAKTQTKETPSKEKSKNKASDKGAEKTTPETPPKDINLKLSSDKLSHNFSLDQDKEPTKEPEENSRTASSQSSNNSKSSNSNQKPSSKQDTQLRLEKFSNARPFQSSGFSGNFGSSDFLPNIQDGSITLLNTKADKYAVFVRRVASQVFASLKQEFSQKISARELLNMQEGTVVEAILTPKGELIEMQLKDSSTNINFDSILKNSVKRGAWDKNPPSGALAEDGNIHFIFMAKGWVRPPQGGLPPQRWLLLGTGLL